MALGKALGVGFGISGGVGAILGDGNTVAWFDSAENITKDGSNLVSAWGDKSGLNHDLLQAGADSIKPVWSSDGVQFDGVNDFMKCVAFTLVQPQMVYIVFKQNTWAANDGVFDGNGDYSMLLRQATTTPGLYIWAGSASGLSSDLALNTFGVVRTLFNGASSKLIVNDNTPITGNFGAGNAGGFTLATRGSGGLFYANVQVKEIVIRKVADTAPNEQTIYDYLKDKYSI